MRDGYRYFVSRPTGPEGDPIGPGTFYRVSYTEVAEVSDEKNWRRSVIQPMSVLLDAVLRSGATLRELLDPEEVPHA